MYYFRIETLTNIKTIKANTIQEIKKLYDYYSNYNSNEIITSISRIYKGEI